MISSLISKYMIKKIANPTTPIIKKKRCVNNLQKRQSCSLCKEICSKNAISLENEVSIKDELCDNCNICASVCLTGNIVPTYEVLEKQFNVISSGDTISICCDKEDIAVDLKVGCLASLPWEYIAYICLENKINLFIKNCRECEEEKLFSVIQNNLKKVETFLGEELFNKKVRLVEDNSELRAKEYTRRDLLKLFGEQSKRLATTVVPINFEENKNARIYRDLLIKKIQNLGVEGLAYNWPSIKVNNNCWGCGICERLCPQSAIKISEDNGEYSFIHNHNRCTHCGLCKTVCLDKSIELVSVKRSVNDELVNQTIKVIKCSVCGDPIKEDDEGTCIVCKNKQKSRY